MKKNLLDLDLQHFADEAEDAGENEVEEPAALQEDESSEDEESETGEENGDAEPHEQSAEENAQYAAMRRRAEAEAQKKFDGIMGALNQRVSAMCNGVTHPVTGQPVTNVMEYFDALEIQERKAREEELKEKGLDPSYIDRAIASNPTVLQAQQILRHQQEAAAAMASQNDFAEIQRIDPSIKSLEDVPNLNEVVRYVERNNVSIVDAYKVINYDILTQNTKNAGRQAAINQMRGKDHLASQNTGVATDNNDDVEVPSEIMARMKAEGKTEKQIKELFKKTVQNGLSI